MPRRILLHPGFHKTGTSAMQQFLWINRDLLAPHVHLLMLRHLKQVAKTCMYFAYRQNPFILTDLAEQMDRALADHLPPGDQDILISCEGLSGHAPGWPRVDSYAAAPVTISYLAGYLTERFPGAEVMVVLSTRAADPWLDSLWRHHLLTHRLVEDVGAFAARLAGAADLTALAAEVQAAIAPVPVYTLSLDQAATHPQGPGGALLELIDLPEDLRLSLAPVPSANRGPDAALAAQLLALNRSGLGDEALKLEKHLLAEAAGVGGWR
jgi:hypothetical protein